MTTTHTGSLAGKVALITGGTSGIGRETALEFARRGTHVVVTGRRDKEGRDVADAARALGVKSLFVQADVSKEADVQRAVAEAMALTGRLDIAFNNAGVEGTPGIPVVEQTEAHYRQVFDINVLGVLLSMKHQVRAMSSPRTGAPGGSIINTSSVAGSVGMAGVSVYVASKHAVNGLTKSAALEFAKNNIRINTVSPAAIETPMLTRFTDALGKDSDKYLASLHPVGRIGTAGEIAKAVVWLSSPEASFVTGTDLLVDGGFTAQ